MRRAIGGIVAAALLWGGTLLLPAAASAQGHDPTTQSTLVLLAAPRDGVAYREVRIRAAALLAERKYAEAEPLAEQLTREYPRDGENWILLARVKANLDKRAEAAAAYERAGALLGWDWPYYAGINAAVSHLAAGNRRAALDRMRRDVFDNRAVLRRELYDRTALATLRDDPEFREITGRPDTTGWSRDEGWRRDVDFLYNEVKRGNPDYHDNPFPAAFQRRYQELKQNVPRLSDEEIYVGMLRMLAVLHQGHVGLWPSPVGQGRIQDRAVPVQLYAFPEGVFIVNATDDHRGLIGSRLLAVESTPTEEALRRVSETRSVAGDMEYVASGPIRLRSVPLLKGLRIIDSTDSVRLTVQAPGGRSRTVRLATAALQGMEQLGAAPGVTPPLFLRNLAEMHWEQALPEHDALYVQLNAVVNDRDEALPAFGQRVRRVLAEGGAGNLILDLRHNGGGNSSLYIELLRTAVAFTSAPGNRLYVLIGRQTYSAAGNLVTDLERLADPVFVGEATSDCCHLYGDPSRVTLPYSGIPGGLTVVRWNLSGYPTDARREMSPDVPVQLTAQAYFAGKDPALEAVFRMIAAGRSTTPGR